MSDPAAVPPSSRPYGPQTAALRRFLQRLAALSDAEQGAVAAAYEAAQRSAPFRTADRELAQAIERSGRADERDAMLGPLLHLVRTPGAPPPADDESDPALLPIAEAALAAALALLAHDLLSARAFAALYAPFTERIPPAAVGIGPNDA